MVLFLKKYAKKEGITFAEAIREAVVEKKEAITKTTKKKTKKKDQPDPFADVIREARKKFKGTKTYHNDLTDDELLYLYDK